jgi:hypothetical protein
LLLSTWFTRGYAAACVQAAKIRINDPSAAFSLSLSFLSCWKTLVGKIDRAKREHVVTDKAEKNESP